MSGDYRVWRNFVFLRDGGRCQLCSKILHLENTPRATLDHIIPRVAGGSDHHTNLQLACQECNEAKGAVQFIAIGAVVMEETPPAVIPRKVMVGPHQYV